MSGPGVAAQGRALLRMTLQGVVNSLRHRQGAGALVVLSLNEKGFEEGKLVTPLEQAGASEAKPTP